MGRASGKWVQGFVNTNIDEIFLNNLNDIHVKGTCKFCNGYVARTLEFGEDKDFYDKAVDFRFTLNN
ncbi:MAG: hypothetical protein K9I94_07525 [Bacteroidales bacterium]|nr:hypothetical protein [Bacteroidales bacterium]